MAVLTDAHGRPIEPPAPPRPDATIEEKVAWLRASSAHNDKVASLANAAFAKQFNRSLRGK